MEDINLKLTEETINVKIDGTDESSINVQIVEEIINVKVEAVSLPTLTPGNYMVKSEYDTDDNGKVDNADNSDKLEGYTADQLRDRTTHTGTQLSSTISDFDSHSNTLIDNKITILKGESDPFPQYLTQSEGDDSYDPLNAAANAIQAHLEATDPHPQYLTPAEGNAAYDLKNTAQGLMTAHLAAADPHPQYVTDLELSTVLNDYLKIEDAFTQSDAEALFQPIGDYVIPADIADFITEAEGDARYILQGTPIGGGDMYKSVYDINDNGIVDNSEKLEGEDGAHYLDRENHTGTQLANTISNFNTATDARVSAGITSLKGETDPFPQYLTPAEADATYQPLGSYLTKSLADTYYDEIGIAASTMADHLAETDPHPQYLTPAEGSAAYDSIGSATAAVSAHVSASDPHPQYLTEAEGDSRYILQDTPIGGGDMYKSTYDINDNGKVDIAENSEKLAGEEPEFYLDRENQTGTQTVSTISDYTTATDTRIDSKIGNLKLGGVEVDCDGFGEQIEVGSQGWVLVPFSGTITSAVLLAKESGNIVIDIYNDTYANFPPDISDKITGSSPPTLASNNKSVDNTLTGWTTTISAGTILKFNINSCSGITKCTLFLKITKD